MQQAWPNKPAGASRLLFIGDVYGEPGQKAVCALLPGLIRDLGSDVCVVNAENSDGGKGLSPAIIRKLFDAGADVLTGGNHTLYREKAHAAIDEHPRVLRPLNLPPEAPGRGIAIIEVSPRVRWGVVNLIGRAMMPPSDDPFRLGKQAVESLREETPLIFVDFHAEATAEKIALARYLDGAVTALIGTHTHVQTADEEILTGGTAYLTDAGMSGPHNGVIGMDTSSALHRFLHPMGGGRSGVATGEIRVHGAFVDADPVSGKALAIGRIRRDFS
ncbi:MAG: YmdB family metallophosphoesterase [Calditrichaeota bacterium]|nr:YmdB family metallophosphoesterase [Calditrichota bacterium]MCB9366330.1 YmdB family metallophosphoesterase [Calditrichota bacterium]